MLRFISICLQCVFSSVLFQHYSGISFHFIFIFPPGFFVNVLFLYLTSLQKTYCKFLKDYLICENGFEWMLKRNADSINNFGFCFNLFYFFFNMLYILYSKQFTYPVKILAQYFTKTGRNKLPFSSRTDCWPIVPILKKMLENAWVKRSL